MTLLDRKGDLSLSRALAQRVGSRGLAMNSAGDYIVRVGAKHILESNLLCVMIADAITEVEGFEGECVYDNGPGMGAFYALVNDTIHLYVDYTGTVYSEYIRSRPEVPRRLQCPDGNITGDFRCTEPLRDDLRTFDQELRKHLLPRTAHSGDRLAALRMWSVVNNWALLVSKPFAEEHGLVESGASQLPLSLLLAKRDVWAQLKVCGYEEFMYRRDALAGLEQRAGAVVADVDISRPNKRYCRLRRANVTQADGGCTLIDGYQTDPQVTLLVESGDAVEVVDDIQYWPRYTLVALSQQWFADEHLGRLRAALESVHMSQASMLQALNRLTYGTAQPEIDDFEQRCKDGQYGIELSRIRQDPSMRERLAQEAQRLPYVDALTVSP
ncbi:MAG: glycine betaine ABC transporter substrate-binding protein [Myxococcota bacterium]